MRTSSLDVFQVDQERKGFPLNAVKEACEINRNRQDAPSHSKVLSECAAGARFGITAEEEVEKPAVVHESGEYLYAADRPTHAVSNRRGRLFPRSKESS